MFCLSRELGGEEVPEDWRGGLDITYRFGKMRNATRRVRMNTKGTNEIRKAENIIAMIRGAVEPGKFISRNVLRKLL